MDISKTALIRLAGRGGLGPDYCRGCGTELEGAPTYCPECGIELEPETPEEPSDTGRQESDLQSEGTPGYGRLAILIVLWVPLTAAMATGANAPALGLGGLLALIGIPVLWYDAKEAIDVGYLSETRPIFIVIGVYILYLFTLPFYVGYRVYRATVREPEGRPSEAATTGDESGSSWSWPKRIGVAFVGFFVFLFLIGAVAVMLGYEPSTDGTGGDDGGDSGSVFDPGASSFVAANASELTLRLDDFEAGWSKLDDESDSVNRSGFIDGHKRSFFDGESRWQEVVTSVYRFTSESDADSYYGNRVASIEANYSTEVRDRGDAAIFWSEWGDHAATLGRDENVVFLVNAYKHEYRRRWDPDVDWASRIVADRIGAQG